MKLASIAAATAFVFASHASAGAPADLDAAVRAFFAKHGANGSMELLDPAAGVKKALTLPAQPNSVYQADAYYVVSYDASDAQSQKVDVDVFVNGGDGAREITMVYVSARPVIAEMAAKGQLQKVH